MASIGCSAISPVGAEGLVSPKIASAVARGSPSAAALPNPRPGEANVHRDRSSTRSVHRCACERVRYSTIQAALGGATAPRR
jgi:hypothetical protein